MKHLRFDIEDSGRVLRCPRCGERLQSVDVEVYSSCPYCEYRFPASAEMEDFAIDPVVRIWVGKCGASPSAVPPRC